MRLRDFPLGKSAGGPLAARRQAALRSTRQACRWDNARCSGRAENRRRYSTRASGTALLSLRFLGLRLLIVGGVQRVLEMNGVKFLDHLDAGAAVLGDLIDVGAVHQAQANIGVAQAIGGATIAVAVVFETGALKNAVEQALVLAGE